MAALQALIFDVDGTLADTERDGHRVAFNQAFAAADLDWHWSVADYGELLSVTGGKERIRYFIETRNPQFETAEPLDAFIAGLHQAKNTYYQNLLKAGEIPLRPGVRRLLAEAQAQGISLAIATTTTLENVLVLLAHTLGPESADWFTVIAAGDMVPAKKPAPDIFNYALEKTGWSAANCLAFEDSGNGLKSSIQAGLKTVVTVNGYTQNHDFQAACLVIDQLGEPDAPFQVLSGPATASHMTIELAQSLIAD